MGVCRGRKDRRKGESRDGAKSVQKVERVQKAQNVKKVVCPP